MNMCCIEELDLIKGSYEDCEKLSGKFKLFVPLKTNVNRKMINILPK